MHGHVGNKFLSPTFSARTAMLRSFARSREQHGLIFKNGKLPVCPVFSPPTWVWCLSATAFSSTRKISTQRIQEAAQTSGRSQLEPSKGCIKEGHSFNAGKITGFLHFATHLPVMVMPYRVRRLQGRIRLID